MLSAKAETVKKMTCIFERIKLISHGKEPLRESLVILHCPQFRMTSLKSQMFLSKSSLLLWIKAQH